MQFGSSINYIKEKKKENKILKNCWIKQNNTIQKNQQIHYEATQKIENLCKTALYKIETSDKNLQNTIKNISQKNFKRSQILSKEETETAFGEMEWAADLFPGLATKFKIVQFDENIRIGYLNINGAYKEKINRNHPYIKILIEKFKCSILIFSELRHNNCKPPKIEGFSLTALINGKSSKNRNTGWASGGLVAYADDKIKDKIKIIFKSKSEYTIWLQIKNKEKKINIIGTYITPKTSQYSEIDKWIKEIETHLEAHKKETNIIIGDLNAHFGIKLSKQKENSHGKKLKKLFEKHNLKMQNEIWCPNQPTFVRNNINTIIDIVA